MPGGRRRFAFAAPAGLFLFLLVAPCLLPGAGALAAVLPGPLPRDLARLEAGPWPRLYRLAEPDVRRLALELQAEPVPRRVASLAFLQVGAPYRGGALGEETPPDTDPLIRYDVTDCAILNLVAVALAHADTRLSPRQSMLVAGYRPDASPTFAGRLHFTTDRLDSSPYFRDVTAEVGCRELKRRVVTLNRRAGGGRWIEIPWEKRRSVAYIPAGIRFPWWSLPEVLGVAFVREEKFADGLDVMHEGLLYRGKTVVHASSKQGRVITEPLSAMLRRYDGVVLFEYR